jgi:hypothetical protein
MPGWAARQGSRTGGVRLLSAGGPKGVEGGRGQGSMRSEPMSAWAIRDINSRWQKMIIPHVFMTMFYCCTPPTPPTPAPATAQPPTLLTQFQQIQPHCPLCSPGTA